MLVNVVALQLGEQGPRYVQLALLTEQQDLVTRALLQPAEAKALARALIAAAEQAETAVTLSNAMPRIVPGKA